jgi:hypothetical protein
MKALILTELRKLGGMLITEEVYNDLFQFLEQDPRKMTMGTAYYVHSMDSYMNKNIVGQDGVKMPNPMYGKLYKNTRFMFGWSDTYGRAVERKNPEHVMGQRSGTYEKVQGYDVLETGKSGLYLPIIPSGSESTYSVLEDGVWSPISKDEVYQYLRPVSPSSGGSGVNFRPLIIDKVAKLTGGGNVWTNPNFKGKYMGPGQA